MKQRYFIYGTVNNGQTECICCCRYEEVARVDRESRQIIRGEQLKDIWNVRGGLDYINKHGIELCLPHRSFEELIRRERNVFPDFEPCEPYEI